MLTLGTLYVVLSRYDVLRHPSPLSEHFDTSCGIGILRCETRNRILHRLDGIALDGCGGGAIDADRDVTQ
jgi:hypothetical protein